MLLPFEVLPNNHLQQAVALFHQVDQKRWVHGRWYRHPIFDLMAEKIFMV